MPTDAGKPIIPPTAAVTLCWLSWSSGNPPIISPLKSTGVTSAESKQSAYTSTPGLKRGARISLRYKRCERYTHRKKGSGVPTATE